MLFAEPALSAVSDHIDAVFYASCLPKHILDEIATYAISGYEMPLNPKQAADFVLYAWMLPSAVFEEFADLMTYDLGKWTRQFQSRTLGGSFRWMQKAKLDDIRPSATVSALGSVAPASEAVVGLPPRALPDGGRAGRRIPILPGQQ